LSGLLDALVRRGAGLPLAALAAPPAVPRWAAREEAGKDPPERAAPEAPAPIAPRPEAPAAAAPSPAAAPPAQESRPRTPAAPPAQPAAEQERHLRVAQRGGAPLHRLHELEKRVVRLRAHAG